MRSTLSLHHGGRPLSHPLLSLTRPVTICAHRCAGLQPGHIMRCDRSPHYRLYLIPMDRSRLQWLSSPPSRQPPFWVRGRRSTRQIRRQIVSIYYIPRQQSHLCSLCESSHHGILVAEMQQTRRRRQLLSSRTGDTSDDEAATAPLRAATNNPPYLSYIEFATSGRPYTHGIDIHLR